jgi:hypothetical protein
MKSKKLVSLVSAFALSFSLAAAPLSAFAADGDVVTVLLNGAPMEFEDTQAILMGDRTMVPMRAIFEAMGANVEWFEENQLIIATKGTQMISMMIGKNRLIIQDITKPDPEIIELDVAPYIDEGGRTLVPARAVAESLDATVGWDEATQTVTITQADETAEAAETAGGATN